MTADEERAICLRCTLPECDDKDDRCGLNQSLMIDRIAQSIVISREMRITRAFQAIQQSQQ